MSAVVNFYVIQIKLGRITLEQVPEKYRDQVKEALGK